MKILKLTSNTILFLLGIYLVISNRKNIGLKYLGLMTLGLGILFFLLYSYNKKYK